MYMEKLTLNETSMEKKFSAFEIGCNMYLCSGRKKKKADWLSCGPSYSVDDWVSAAPVSLEKQDKVWKDNPQ